MRIHTVIVSGGNIREDFALSFFKENVCDHLIAVDNGLRFLYEHDIRPTRIVGDFDTIDELISLFKRFNQ